jgi:hypothetical protein
MGFFQVTCKLKVSTLDQNSPAPLDGYCDTSIDGVTAASIPPNGLVTYAIAPGKHTVVVRAKSDNSQWITLQPATFNPTIYAGVTQKQTATVTGYQCQYTWTLAIDPTMCATGPATTAHMVQEGFERGRMLWNQSNGVYEVLTYQQTSTTGPIYSAFEFFDPLNVQGDSSGSVGTPPPDLFAPINGFGSIWRGDVPGASWVRGAFGWAVTQESGYEATIQCGNEPNRPHSGCFMSMPDGWVIEIWHVSSTGFWKFYTP